MESALVNAITSAANNPGFVTFTILFGLVAYWLFNRGVIVPGVVSELLVKLAKLEAEGQACKDRNEDLLARVKALESQIEAHLRAST